MAFQMSFSLDRRGNAETNTDPSPAPLFVDDIWDGVWINTFFFHNNFHHYNIIRLSFSTFMKVLWTYYL